MSEAERIAPGPTWWQRNKSWAMPVGCVVLLLAGSCLAVTGVVAVGAGKLFDFARTEAQAVEHLHDQAFDRAQASFEVTDALGQPVERGAGGNRNYTRHNEVGTYVFTVPLSGPKGDGVLHAEAVRSDGQWEFAVLEVRRSGKETIDLMDTGFVQ